MKKFYILSCLIFLITSFVYSKPVSRDFAEIKARITKQNILGAQLMNRQATPSQKLKSIEIKPNMLEEITFTDGSKKEFAYDHNGRTIGYKYYKFDDVKSSVLLTDDNTFTYDNNGNRILQAFYTLLGGEMTLVEKDEFEYDSQNREILHIFWEYSNDSSSLVKSIKTITFYQADLIKTEEYSWNGSSQTWDLEAKTEIESENGNMVKGTYYMKNEENGEIVLSMIAEASYNPDGTLKQTVIKAVDSETGLMVEFMKSEMTYDSNGHEVLNVDSMFEPESGTWFIMSQTKSIYDSNVLKADEYYSMDWLTFQVSLYEKHEYSYTNGKLTQEMVLEDLDYDGELSQSYKFEFAYDNSIDIDNVILPDSWIEHNDYTDIWGQFQFSHGALSNVKWYQWDYASESLTVYRDATYHYSQSSGEVGVNNMNVSTIKVAPNPFNESITFSLPENENTLISIYNVAGQLVYNSSASITKTINTSEWKSGIYVIKTYSPKGSPQIMKLVKR